MNKCNNSQKQKKGQKAHDHTIRYKNTFDKIQQPFMIKKSEENKRRRLIYELI